MSRTGLACAAGLLGVALDPNWATNCDDNGGATNGSDQIMRIIVT